MTVSVPEAGLTAGELAAEVGGTVEGDRDRRLSGVAGLAEAAPDQLSFFASNARYRPALEATRAGAVLVAPDVRVQANSEPVWIRVLDPYLAFARLSARLNPEREPAPGISAQAWVEEGAEIDPTASIAPFVVIEAGARVGPGTRIEPFVHVGREAVLGEDCRLGSNSVVTHRCILGDRVRLQPGAIVGSDGFGYAFDPEGEPDGPRHLKVPQVGIVRIEDDVELGAGVCVDRATTGETVIGRGTKIDNLVQLAHNVKVGPLSLICAQAGVSGSTQLGAGVILAGQVGVVGHLKVGDGARVGAQSGVAHDVEPGATLSGSPATDHRRWLRASAAAAQLPELIKELRRLKRRVDELEKESER